MTSTRQAPGTRILQDPSGAPSLVVRRARLRIVGGPDLGREEELAGRSLSVGSDPGCDLVVRDPAVSARHFSLSATEHGILLRDLGSTNGTFVDGYRVGQITMNEGSSIVAGESRFELAMDDGEVSLPLAKATNFGELRGHSPPMRALFAVLEQAAKSDATVLVLGESGTGKELAARGLHDRSARRDGPYVVFDAGAASATLVESQLFGHAKGAFTGATETREGCFEAADGGTLVLDEIGELPLALRRFPEERPARAAAVLDSLDAWLARRGGPDRPGALAALVAELFGPGEPLVSPAPRSRSRGRLALVAAGALAVAGTAWLLAPGPGVDEATRRPVRPVLPT
jgi:pSer/pThr/pTyr-binding forkhead associated (FHA) protein